jgi:hypothetical protein
VVDVQHGEVVAVHVSELSLGLVGLRASETKKGREKRSMDIHSNGMEGTE